MANFNDISENIFDTADDSDLSLLYLSTSDDSDDSDDSDTSDAEEPASALRQPGANDDIWSKGPNLTPSPKLDFRGPLPGPTMTVPDDFREIDFFSLFFTLEILQLLVQQTNLYAEQTQAKTGRDQNWTPVTEEEMKAWLGMRVVMSIQPNPTVEMYWSEDCILGGHKISHIMPRDRYQKIAQYLHVADSSTQVPKGQPGYDKLHKVREILEIVRSKCLENYNPHQNTSIDEAMIAFRGRLAFRQYVPAKPTRYGIKVWMRADPENGFVNDFQVYTGKEDRKSEGGLGARVVMDLIGPVQDRHHVVNCDNFFTSPHLFTELSKIGTYSRGTVRHNRKGYPRGILHPKCVKQQGDMVIAQKGEMLAAAWKDKKVFHLLSTADDPATITDTATRKKKNGQQVQVTCPSIVREYNNNMNGVDRADQLRSEFETYRIAKKWWLYLFWFLFDVCVSNSFVMMRESPGHQRMTKNNVLRTRTMLEFRTALAKQLIGQFQGMRKRRRLSNVDEMGNSHWSVKVSKKGRCRQCSKRGIRREMKYRCSACDVPLCPECMEQYHRQYQRH